MCAQEKLREVNCAKQKVLRVKLEIVQAQKNPQSYYR